MAHEITNQLLANNQNYAGGTGSRKPQYPSAFIYDVDSGKLSEVSFPGPTGSIG
jgi:hypothetical protein